MYHLAWLCRETHPQYENTMYTDSGILVLINAFKALEESLGFKCTSPNTAQEGVGFNR